MFLASVQGANWTIHGVKSEHQIPQWGSILVWHSLSILCKEGKINVSLIRTHWLPFTNGWDHLLQCERLTASMSYLARPSRRKCGADWVNIKSQNSLLLQEQSTEVHPTKLTQPVICMPCCLGPLGPRTWLRREVRKRPPRYGTVVMNSHDQYNEVTVIWKQVILTWMDHQRANHVDVTS